MPTGLRVAAGIIVHATEDASRIRRSLEELGLYPVSQSMTEGHYGNEIILLEAHLGGHKAEELAKKMVQAAEPGAPYDESAREAHLRFDKQDLVSGRLIYDEHGALRIHIRAPAYDKGAAESYARLFEGGLNRIYNADSAGMRR